jgi:hypothetical protein
LQSVAKHPPANNCRTAHTQAMNSSINASSKYAYHTFESVELSGVFDRIVNNDLTGECKYHLFIRYGDKVYMDVKGVGEIVIPFAELQQNKYWKYYYDLSLLLTNNKNMVVQDLKYSSEYNDCQLYDEARFWSIDTASIENDLHNNTLMVISYDDNCFYKICPYDLENIGYTSQEDLNIFRQNYMMGYECENMWGIYYNLAIEYQTNLIQKKFEEIL